jgi:hypothetical protein
MWSKGRAILAVVAVLLPSVTRAQPENTATRGKIGRTKGVFALGAYQPSAWRVYGPAAAP